MRSFFSLSHMTAGFVAVMVGFTSSVILVFQAATAAGASHAEISSWLFALGISIASACVGLSWYYRMPILIGWSTSGAALLATSLAGVSMPNAIGAFVFAAGLTVIAGVSGLFEKIMVHIPRYLSSAMLAGILLHFGLNLFVVIQHQYAMVGLMLLTYLVGKRLFPRAVILFVLLVGVSVAKLQGLLQLEAFHIAFTTPVCILPEFSMTTLLSIGIPLFIVTMTSQNIPGIAVLNASGFKPPVSSLMTWTGLSNILFAPFGSYSICLTALTAAICAGKEADENPKSRYKSTLFAGLCWLAVGIFGATLVNLFFLFPKDLVIALAGLALLGTLGNSLKTALEEEAHREPALITILVSASGLSLFGVGAACWGLLVGILSNLLLAKYKKESVVKAAA